ncbi:MAG: hypothetical protein HC912_00015 [Saprospiraceae bacterium]|nr:hypothetical protein [Saprospiraceae bacterium]
MSRIIFSLVLVSIMCACNNEKNKALENEQDYSYLSGLKDYLKKISLEDIFEDNQEYILFILDLEGCNSCLESTLNLIQKNQDERFLVVFSYKDKKLLEKYKVSFFTKRYISDSNNLLKIYDTGVIAPTVFHIRKGKIVFVSETNHSNERQIKEYFSWN